MLYEILPDPRGLRPTSKKDGAQVLQIHRPIPESVPVGHFEANGREVVDATVSRGTYLDWLQQACAALGDNLEVRFFDHFEDEFDASVLDHLSEIRRLSIDGLPRVRHPEAIGRLPKLTFLRFGPRRLDSAKILTVLGVQRLIEFTLAGTPTPTIDLSPFAEARSLRTLRLLGSGKNIEAIGHVASLTELAFQPSAKASLDFINRLDALEVLKFVLGNAPSITAIESLPALRDLSFREVHYLEELGDPR
jgi:hypothetical protein